jgi:4-diphosphocytidyl-2-C-methyl-D-erythritol kinase
MICFPNAKINIGLNIIERRSDNFHNIETFYYPVPLSDILEIIVAEKNVEPKVSLKITGMKIGGKIEDNLCYKAYKILADDFPLPSVNIYLHKIIPMGSGLGGGSSDGANTLTLLNKMFQLGLGSDELKRYSGKLGSDCPFFIDNHPSIGLAKGDNLINININLAGCYLVIAKPGISVSTSEAYRGIIPSHPEIPLQDLIKNPINLWNEKIANDFEKTIFNSHSEIKAVKDKMYNNGALYASMTGSGSAVYGIFENEVNLRDSFMGMFYWSGFL